MLLALNSLKFESITKLGFKASSIDQLFLLNTKSKFVKPKIEFSSVSIV